jgi:outer membrane protein OmpA-like peptidoglycan-associated protein
MRSYYLFFLLLLFSCCCCTFPKAVRSLQKGDTEQAKALFAKAKKHPTYGPGARYYLSAIQMNAENDIRTWLEVQEEMCGLEQEVRQLSRKQIIKLKKYQASSGDIRNTRRGLQTRVFRQMMTSGRIPQLRQLEEQSGCWSETAIDSLRRLIVNKTINPANTVFNSRREASWEPAEFSPLTEEAFAKNLDRPYFGMLDLPEYQQIRFDDVRMIRKRYTDAILPSNYVAFWKIQENGWPIFLWHKSYCDMDTFLESFPDKSVTKDCWFGQAKDALCAGDLKSLLNFHRNYPHSALDVEISHQIMYAWLMRPSPGDLSQAEEQRMLDILALIQIQQAVSGCGTSLPDTAQLIGELAELVKTYPEHKLAYEVTRHVLNAFSRNQQYDDARRALHVLRPLFRDSMVCANPFEFQVRKDQWFEEYSTLLKRTGSEGAKIARATAWNTPTHDEYGLISWGDTEEVFFVRRNRKDGAARIMRSVKTKNGWSKPSHQPKLSLGPDVVPLSISHQGRMLLLKANGRLYRTYRMSAKEPWMQPDLLPTPGRFAGHAWISPNDSIMLFNQFQSSPTPLQRPTIGIAGTKRNEGGGFGAVTTLLAAADTSEINITMPLMALQGRMLFFVSDRTEENLGQNDLFRLNYQRPGDWSSAGPVENLGLPFSTLTNDRGLTYFAESTNIGYFERADLCSEQLDIWEIELESDLFPEALRLAGQIVDENNKPIGGGFMEFTANYDLDVHFEPISRKGTYTYTVEDSTQVVRLFPEIPGYYSERDTTHHVREAERGTIMRDTFRLLSFDYLRQHFELVHSTFQNGTAEFDCPSAAYPELTRLAKIAIRMGARLELTGHTDGTGTEAENLRLSIERAESVRRYLIEKCGFPADHVTAIGYGSANPECDNITEAGRRCNRRVEVVFRMPEVREATEKLGMQKSDKPTEGN